MNDPARDELHLIPTPTRVTRLPGEWQLTPTAAVRCDPGIQSLADLAIEDIERATGWHPMPGGSEQGAIAFRLDPSVGPESYRLRVQASGVDIVAGDSAGGFYGWQTLRQLLPPEFFGSGPREGVRWAAPAVDIVDQPAFGWRGALLDVGRRFFGVPYVLRFIDLIAAHKLNVLHLHLTEDSGWRVPIERYPRLTQIGAWRRETVIGAHHHDDPSRDRYDGVPHGGYYTRSDLRRILEYAARRHVTVVPEVEVPGHAQAAIAAYPEWGCTGRQLDVATTWGISPSVLNAEASTLQAVENIFTEIFDLFPSEYVHAGGDECPKDEWRASPRMQQLIRERGLTDEDELQSWFTTQLSQFFAANGRRLIGWDEILQGGLADGATVMSWRGEDGGIAAARAGHDVIMTPQEFTYFDYYQSPAKDLEPLAMDAVTTLQKVYEFQPIPQDLAGTAEAGHVLGSQFAIWGEYAPDIATVEYRAFPRACAFAEAVWSPATARSWPGFLGRLDTHLRRLDEQAVHYRRPTEDDRNTG